MPFSEERQEGACYIFTDASDRRYLTGVDLAEGLLLVSEDSYLFADARYFYPLKKLLKGSGVTPVLYKGLGDVAEFIKSGKAGDITAIYLDFDKTSAKDYLFFKGVCDRVENCAHVTAPLREIKTPSEERFIGKACDIALKTLYSAVRNLKEGVTEREVKNYIERTIKDMGAEDTSFDTIVAFGKNTAVPHHVSGNSKLKKDCPVLIDMGCKINGYCSDITRTFFFGNPTEEFIKVYEAVKEANAIAEKNIKVGTDRAQADAFARDYLTEKGYGEYFTHSLGHGVGLDIHEAPFLSPKASGELKENTVFTVEPGVYIDGKFGVRIEDTVILKVSGVKSFYRDEKSYIIAKN